MFQTKVAEKIKTHILCSVTISRKPSRIANNGEKHGTTRQATEGITHAHCVLDT